MKDWERGAFFILNIRGDLVTLFFISKLLCVYEDELEPTDMRQAIGLGALSRQ